MVCILCGKSGLRSALTLPCDEHYVCKPCVDRPVMPYTDADATRWLDDDQFVHALARVIDVAYPSITVLRPNDLRATTMSGDEV